MQVQALPGALRMTVVSELSVKTEESFV